MNKEPFIKIPKKLLEELKEDITELYNLSYSNYRFSDKKEKLHAEYVRKMEQLRVLLGRR